MRFRQHQSDAQQASRRLLLWFALLLIALVAVVNLSLAGLYHLLLPGLPLPAFFWATNTGLVLLLVGGGAWLEMGRLRSGGGERVARWAGGRLLREPRDLPERRLLNVVDEMALASGLPRPAVYLLEREDGINAFVAGWTAETAALAVTRGALERLTREELQGLVAHEFGHIREGDLALNMRLLALVWGLSLVHGLGLELTERDDLGRLPPLAPVGLVLRALGGVGWLAGRLLQAAVSRQREYLADACAMQFTRSRDGLGNTLRKIWFLQRGPEGRLRSPHAEALAAMLLDDGARRRWLATHPPLALRIERLTGRGATPLPAPRLQAGAGEAGSEPWPAPAQAMPAGVLAAAPASVAATAWAFAGPSHPALAPDARAPRAHPGRTTRPATGGLPGATTSRLDAKAEGPAAQTPAPTQAQADLQAARARLERLHGPAERRCGVLAALLPPGDGTPARQWAALTAALPHAATVRADLALLPPGQRLQVWDLLLARTAAAPAGERRALVQAARSMLFGSGPVQAGAVLQYAALRLALQPVRHPVRRPSAAPAPAAADRLSDHAASRADVAPRWAALVHAALADDGAPVALPPAERQALRRELRALRRLPPMQRPAVLKAWCGSRFQSAAALPGPAAAALHAATRLLDLPGPPAG